MTVYFIQRMNDKSVKIGYSSDVNMRIRTLRSEHGAIKVLGTMKGDKEVERLTQLQFAEHCIPGMRFMSGQTSSDWFRPAPELMEYIEKVAKPYRVQSTIYLRFPVSMEIYNKLRMTADENGIPLTQLLEDVVTLYASVMNEPKATADEQTA